MKKLTQLYHKHKELVLYIVFGALTTLVNYIVYSAFYFLLRSGLGEDNAVLAANVAAWVAAVAFAYVTNKLFVFEQKSWAAPVIRRELPSFLSARLFSLVMEEILLLLLIKTWKGGILAWLESLLNLPREDIATWYDICVKLPTQAMVLVLNYFFSKFVVFRKKKEEETAA